MNSKFEESRSLGECSYHPEKAKIDMKTFRGADVFTILTVVMIDITGICICPYSSNFIY